MLFWALNMAASQLATLIYIMKQCLYAMQSLCKIWKNILHACPMFGCRRTELALIWPPAVSHIWSDCQMICLCMTSFRHCLCAKFGGKQHSINLEERATDSHGQTAILCDYNLRTIIWNILDIFITSIHWRFSLRNFPWAKLAIIPKIHLYHQYR